MATRFLVSGVQLGMIKGIVEAEEDNELTQIIVEIVNEILKSQYVGRSTSTIEKDVDAAVCVLGFET